VTTEAPALLTLDHGAATTSVALVARLDRRWRLVGAHAAPSGLDPDEITARLLDRIRAADSGILAALGIPAGGGRDPGLPRLEVHSTPASRIAVAAATERAARPFVDAATVAGWRVGATTADRHDPLAMADRLLDPAVDVILAAAGEPAGADERGAIAELTALVLGIAARRPHLRIALAGAVAAEVERRGRPDDRPGELLTVPTEAAALAGVLRSLRVRSGDARVALARTAGTLAEVLDRRVEILEIGLRGGLRACAEPGEPGEAAIVRSSIVAAGGLFGDEVAEGFVEGVAGWTALPIDRLRLADRLAELRDDPWADPTGDGARLRLAAVRAAMTRLLAADPTSATDPPPDVLVVSGGAWAVAPAPAVALAIADVVRRPGATQLVLDHARVLAPLGAIEDPADRRLMLRDLAGDVLAPLAGLLVAGGLKPGHAAGRLRVGGGGALADVELVPGGLELVDLPPGETALVELDLQDGARVAGRSRRVALEIAGGLAGLLVDLRGVPLRLPDRTDARRELLAAWERALWTGLES
jgi:hypothetical protein